MQTERMTPERRAEIERVLADGDTRDVPHFRCAIDLLDELRAAEAENRMLREGLDHIVNQSGDSPYEILCQVCRDGKTQCWSRKHSKDVARDTLARAGGGADAAV